MKHTVFLGLGLFGAWLLWSGHYTPLIISFGVVSCVLVTVVASRMGIIDDESVPVDMAPRLLLYLPWLAWQVVLANFAVAKVILTPSLPIAPRIIRTKATQKKELAMAIHANSITLTPGTVSIELEERGILVHALTKEAEEDLEAGRLDDQATWLEGGA